MSLSARVRASLEESVVLVHAGEYAFTEEMETFKEINLEENPGIEPALRAEFGVESIPCLLAYGVPYAVEEIQAVKEIERARESAKLEGAIEKIRREKRVLFMKGTPERPECRFSREFIKILGEAGVEPRDYVSVNVLESPAVREGIKAYGDWPTYPQMYADGELLGGLDVIKAELAKGNLKEYLKLV
ncbi:monothiol glutaredoxin [Nematocida major]|uniref:monothiol glutaredoxin n=1 Tax=Nematocida major TaxID=1912982 RepID=UPI00200796C6|nr:monothiol glutaredoxin [Nematocida major]KAH9385311.1 monothiol glutaredoxin [Nematocida major]